MCRNLTTQVRSIAAVTTAVAKGDLGQKVEIEVGGEIETLKNTVNGMVEQVRLFKSDLGRDI
jgi:osomolarity two-component system sensor histidine kinase NIK1